MNELLKMLQRTIGIKFTRKQQRDWTRTFNRAIDDRIRLIQRYSESTEMLSFNEWILLHEGVSDE